MQEVNECLKYPDALGSEMSDLAKPIKNSFIRLIAGC